MSRLSAYQGKSRSRKSTLCPSAVSSRTSARNVVAWPLPQDEVIDSPRTTMSNSFAFIATCSWPGRFGRLTAVRPARRGDHTYVVPGRGFSPPRRSRDKLRDLCVAVTRPLLRRLRRRALRGLVLEIVRCPPSDR